MISRRALIASTASAAGLVLSGCDRLHRSDNFRGLLRSAEGLTMKAQRLIVDRDALAREYSESEMSPYFRPNGTRLPDTTDYARHLAASFAHWRLIVDGLVTTPLSIPLPALRSLPSRTQITRHDCVEGWSAIGKWHGVPLGLLLDSAGLRSEAKYIVFHCADRFGSFPYYESIDLIDAFHPQTILAWGMNDQLLPVQNGAPYGCASSGSLATSMRNMCSESRRSPASRGFIAVTGAIGKTRVTMNGTPGFDPASMTAMLSHAPSAFGFDEFES